MSLNEKPESQSGCTTPEPAEEPLNGGGVNLVTRVGNTVRRPLHLWTPAVHALLNQLPRAGFDGAPAVHGVDEKGREVLDFVPGTVGNYPLTEEVRSEAALLSAGRLLRAYHDASACGVAQLPEGWQLPALEPVEVICHSDFAPYNCVFRDGIAVAIIDFDLARPGPRAWDLAYALYRFAPLTRPGNTDGFGDIAAQADRARQFLDAYGASQDLRAAAVETVVPRLQALVAFIQGAARAGDRNFARHIAAGHLDLYLADIAYILEHRGLLDRAVLGP
ncbi:phosphotransferase [Serinibacter salmoneus]|uniref:Phosphotransferase family enzyme n=1 Tax=Serinibacter salmoneus TaxID=556530 RepID=A0A2A9D3A1_9MICO|nr:phosphotransferase [Serinibacter salmoneus]PFG21188.1 phosphotransferase family enzyme [Serinibacter salmoneus]